MPEEAQRLARVAAVAEDLDKILDKLFANVAELKLILERTEPGTPGAKEKP
jgi:hypothetical protein